VPKTTPRSLTVGVLVVLIAAAGAAHAAVVNRRPSRFDRVVVADPSWAIGQVAETPEAIPGFDEERAGWTAFKAAHGGRWDTWIDRRSGAPLLVQGSGIRWFPAGTSPATSDLEAMARAFVEGNERLFRVNSSQLTVNRPASGAMDADHAIVVFDRVVEGVPVDGGQFLLFVTRGNLVAFGANRWGAIDAPPKAVYGEATAREVLYNHMGILARDTVTDLAAPTKVLIPTTSQPREAGAFAGSVGTGIDHRLVWRFVLRVAGEPGTWSGAVDATTGSVVSLFDDTKYAQAKGGVYPVSDDQLPPDGVEQAGWPMPYADVAINATPATAGDMGIFDCTPSGGTAVTQLAGPYVKVHDNCGAISEQITCDNDLDLRQGPGTDCVVPSGASAGNTHSARSGFYHLNRISEKGRSWLPANAWLQSQLTDNVNINATCNAYWNGASVNFYKSGGGCNNTGEIAGVFLHEWGHGLDNNDGGGYDNPTEAYADVTALISTHVSCIGRGFFQSGNCDGYGDACLSCTGIRDQDWDKHASHTPATTSGFASSNCGGGDGPCGKEQHCEAYVSAEAVYDLAARDLVASGMDSASAWQLTDKLWYKSRQGSGGNAYNCSLPSSDGCAAGSWFTKMRNIDDDDGNLNNGTPHAAAIYAAFNRHKIACGAAGDASNQSTSSCPALQKPTMTTTAGSNSVTLSWSAVPNASNYLILRNDQGCASGHTIVATVPAPTTSYTDTDLPNDYTVYYAVQAQGSNSACESALSTCNAATPQAFAGSIKLGQATYACSSTIQVTVRDANIGAPTTIATVVSSTETAPETVVLTETPSGSGKYVGTIAADSGPAVAGNGRLSIASGDTITARYVDADDGLGGHNLTRETTATGDCVGPVVTQVATSGVDDVQATVTWATNESSTSIVHYGQVKPPAATASTAGLTNAHAVPLTGLQGCTVYWLSVESQDPAGNVATDANGGAYYHFETLGDLGSGLQSCHGGRVTLTSSTVNCSDTLPIRVTDLDVNLSPSVVDTIHVSVASTTETSPETITLTETGVNTSQFTGSIQTIGGAPASDGTLQVAGGDLVSVSYRDADDGTGTPAISTASATVDCSGATASVVDVRSITDDSSVVHWTTNEPTTGRVDWGPTAALGNTASDASLGTNHTVAIGRLLECASYFFRVTTTDAYGNTSTLDAHGVPFTFSSWRIPAGIFSDGFETNTGWTLEGDWQIDAPQGKGTAPADPTTAYQGTKVLGQDLTGLGAKPGDYEANTTFRAITPSINAAGLAGGQLRFRRKLSVGDGGTATITVSRNGVIFDVWSSTSVNDTDWSLQTVNISPYADGATNLKIQIKQKAGTSITHSGWNIDKFIVNSANQPAFEACGGCGAVPSFAGILAAKDASPCADTGVALNWRVAAAWGTGSAGTYVVYRDTTPGFAPSAANRIASGVAGTSYTDAAAPNGVTLYYLVRAENNETCGGGPANGGAVDANTVYAAAQDQTSQVLPGSLGDSVRIAGVNDTEVRVGWTPVANAASYHVYRSASPTGGFTRIGDATGAFFEDRDQFTSTNSWYYDVKAADACGNEGP
jgi:hypothetical protein